MDQPGLAEVEHRRALRSLQRINRLSRSSQMLWPSIARLAQQFPDRPVRLLDVASGGGDLAVALGRRATRRRLQLHVQGCDLSPVAVRYSNQLAERLGASATFHQCDVIREGIGGSYDIVTCSLFLHHLDSEDGVTLLRQMAAATTQLVLINDLIRSRFGYWLAYWGCRLLSRSQIVHTDGPLSVAGAYTCLEALELAERAGLVGATIARHWPERFLLSWRKP